MTAAPHHAWDSLWIVGDSHIARAKRQAKYRPGGYNLNLLDLNLKVHWEGQGGAQLEDLDTLVSQALAKHGKPPYMLIVHLGTNDFDATSRMGMFHKNTAAMTYCLSNLPDTVIIFSEMLPRRFYVSWDGDQREADKQRRKVNGEFASKLNSHELRFIRHNNINPFDRQQYDGILHLSPTGYRMLLDNFENAIRHFFDDHWAFVHYA